MSDFSYKLITWYEENKRDLPWRHTIDPYKIWVSEIMLQQTRVEAVKPYYARFLEELPDIGALARADVEHLNKLWQGLGYYSRVRNMQKAAQICGEKFGGELPRDYQTLLTLPGIGSYTAAAIASFSAGEAIPAIDGNVKRLIARYLLLEQPIDRPETHKTIEEFLRREIPKENAGAFNQATIELGATLCGPDKSARCGGCPLLASCRAFAEEKTDILPRRTPKKEKRIEERTPLILSFNGEIALEKRPEKGLLAGLWELPAIEGFHTEEEVRAFLEKAGCIIEKIEPLPQAKHIFTHIIWEMRGYLVTLKRGGNFTFYGADEREKRALPSAFKAFLGDLRP